MFPILCYPQLARMATLRPQKDNFHCLVDGIHGFIQPYWTVHELWRIHCFDKTSQPMHLFQTKFQTRGMRSLPFFVCDRISSGFLQRFSGTFKKEPISFRIGPIISSATQCFEHRFAVLQQLDLCSLNCSNMTAKTLQLFFHPTNRRPSISSSWVLCFQVCKKFYSLSKAVAYLSLFSFY